MEIREARIWERFLQLWALVFCLTMVRHNAVLAGMLPAPYALTQPFLAVGANWLAAGFLSMAFLCRMCCCGELTELSKRDVRLRMVASVPLGVVALMHSLYQLERRELNH